MKLYLIRHAECGHNMGQAAGDENGHHLTENGRTSPSAVRP
jgi:broad specificity phosphatase PhoE